MKMIDAGGNVSTFADFLRWRVPGLYVNDAGTTVGSKTYASLTLIATH
jgi:hypothetical protein